MISQCVHFLRSIPCESDQCPILFVCSVIVDFQMFRFFVTVPSDITDIPMLSFFFSFDPLQIPCESQCSVTIPSVNVRFGFVVNPNGFGKHPNGFGKSTGNIAH